MLKDFFLMLFYPGGREGVQGRWFELDRSSLLPCGCCDGVEAIRTRSKSRSRAKACLRQDREGPLMVLAEKVNCAGKHRGDRLTPGYDEVEVGFYLGHRHDFLTVT